MAFMMRSDLVTSAPGPQPRRLRFTVDHYYKMIELGMIDNYERAEIIDGEMVPKMTIGDRHGFAVNMLAKFFIQGLGDDLLVSVQNPLRLGEFDEPEPDIVVADLTKYDGKRHPRPEETVLVVEVADSSLRYDREIKLPLYSEAGIQEVWIVNLVNDVVEVHKDPSVGVYQSVSIFGLGEAVVSNQLKELTLQVSDIIS